MKDEALAAKHFTDPEVLLGFMRRTRKPVFHKSNVFFRDIQFAIRDYFDTVALRPISVPKAERMAREVVQLYTASGVLRQVNNQAYVLDSPEWSTPKSGTYSMLTLDGGPMPGTAAEVWPEPPSGAPSEAHVDPQSATDNVPKPSVEHHTGG